MNNDFMKGIKIGLGFIFIVGLFFGVSYAGTHGASQVISGMFQGDFTFNGSINITGSGNAIFFPDGTNQTTAPSLVGGIPSGAVMAFNLSSCPSGWSDFDLGSGRFIIGVGTLGPYSYSLDDIGGEATHTLTQSEMPSHTHSLLSTYSYNPSGSNSPIWPPIGPVSGSSTTTSYTGSAGSSSAHENRPPYLALLYCVKD